MGQLTVLQQADGVVPGSTENDQLRETFFYRLDNNAYPLNKDLEAIWHSESRLRLAIPERTLGSVKTIRCYPLPELESVEACRNTILFENVEHLVVVNDTFAKQFEVSHFFMRDLAYLRHHSLFYE